METYLILYPHNKNKNATPGILCIIIKDLIKLASIISSNENVKISEDNHFKDKINSSKLYFYNLQ